MRPDGALFGDDVWEAGFCQLTGQPGASLAPGLCFEGVDPFPNSSTRPQPLRNRRSTAQRGPQPLFQSPVLKVCCHIGGYRICKTHFGPAPTNHSSPLLNVQIPISNDPGNRSRARCGAAQPYGIALPPTAHAKAQILPPAGQWSLLTVPNVPSPRLPPRPRPPPFPFLNAPSPPPAQAADCDPVEANFTARLTIVDRYRHWLLPYRAALLGYGLNAAWAVACTAAVLAQGEPDPAAWQQWLSGMAAGLLLDFWLLQPLSVAFLALTANFRA